MDLKIQRITGQSWQLLMDVGVLSLENGTRRWAHTIRGYNIHKCENLRIPNPLPLQGLTGL